jgi:hypothetical protein
MENNPGDIVIWGCYDALSNLRDDIAGGIYHYTSTKVLNSILNNGCLWASNMFYVNDKQEYKAGIAALKNFFSGHPLYEFVDKAEHVDGRSNLGVFTISFCSEPDMLQQWITYAKESGVCIGLDKDIALNEAKILSGNFSHKPNNILPIAYFEKVGADDNGGSVKLLDKALVQKTAKAIKLSGVFSEKSKSWWVGHPDFAETFLQLLAAYYKEKSFYGEQEIRAAFLANRDTEIKYFEHSNGVLRPYIEVCFLHEDSNSLETAVEVPIRTIMVGPSGRQQSVFDSVIHRVRYGDTSKVWKYAVGKKREILREFIKGCLQGCPDGVPHALAAYAIAKRWAGEAGYEFCVAERADAAGAGYGFDLAIGEDAQSDIRGGGGAALSENEVNPKKGKGRGKKERAIACAQNYLRDNYLSPHGVWVSKSKSSYLF